jgi:hypothetical protein
MPLLPAVLRPFRCAWQPLSALLLLCLSGPLWAASPAHEPLRLESFTCPLTGKAFKQDVGYNTFPLVTFPDGSYPGDEKVDAQLPVCPADGLILLPDFSPILSEEQAMGDALIYPRYTRAELAKLPALIADPAYAALKADGRYAQAHWLATQLGRPAFDRFTMLQRATWGAIDPALRRKLVERLVTEGPALLEASIRPAPYKRYLRLIIVNGLRELGRFDEALNMLDAIDRDSAAALAQDVIEDAEVSTQEMRAVIVAKDTDRFPVGLMPSRWANVVCKDRDMPPPYARTETTKAACAARGAERDRTAREDEEAFAELDRWRKDVAGLDKACAATPEDKRSKGLQWGCENRQRRRDEAEAIELVKDGDKTALACEAGREEDRNGVLLTACISYTGVLEDELGRALADDDLAWSVICPNGDNQSYSYPDRWHVASSGCRNARDTRKNRAVEAMLGDRAKIDATCAMTPQEKMHGLLFDACLEHNSRRRTETIARLATVPADFERMCARHGKTNSAGNDAAGLSEEQGVCRSAWRLRENTRAKAEAEAKGLKCFSVAVYGPDRPRCVSPAAFEQAMKPGPEFALAPVNNMDYFAEHSSLRRAARTRAAAIIAKAKVDRSYPKRKPGDRF